MSLLRPCSLPDNFDGIVRNAIQINELEGSKKLCLLCPEPLPIEYLAMTMTLCDSYSQLKDKNAKNIGYDDVIMFNQLYRKL